MPEAPAAMPVLSMTRMSLPLPLPLRRRFSARCQAELRPWMPAPMTTYFAWVGKAMKGSPQSVLVAGPRAFLTPELWLDATTKHSDHKPSRFQTNFCKGTEMAKIGAKGGSTHALPGLTLAAGSEISAPQLRVVSDPVRGSSWITGQL